MSDQNCPVCKGALAASPKSGNWPNDYWLFDCPRCGDFKMADWTQCQMLRDLAQLGLKKGDREKLSALIRRERPTDVIRSGASASGHAGPRLEEMLRDVRSRNYGPADNQQFLLRHLWDQTEHLGHRVPVYLDTDFPVIWAHNRDELAFHLNELLRNGFIDLHDQTQRHWIVSVTTSGLAHLDSRPPDVGFHTV